MEKEEKEKLLAQLKYQVELVKNDLMINDLRSTIDGAEGQSQENRSSLIVHRSSSLCPRRLHF